MWCPFCLVWRLLCEEHQAQTTNVVNWPICHTSNLAKFPLWKSYRCNYLTRNWCIMHFSKYTLVPRIYCWTYGCLSHLPSQQIHHNPSPTLTCSLSPWTPSPHTKESFQMQLCSLMEAGRVLGGLMGGFLGSMSKLVFVVGQQGLAINNELFTHQPGLINSASRALTLQWVGGWCWGCLKLGWGDVWSTMTRETLNLGFKLRTTVLYVLTTQEIKYDITIRLIMHHT